MYIVSITSQLPKEHRYFGLFADLREVGEWLSKYGFREIGTDLIWSAKGLLKIKHNEEDFLMRDPFAIVSSVCSPKETSLSAVSTHGT